MQNNHQHNPNNRYDMQQQPQFPQTRGYQRPPGSNIPRQQHPPQHHMQQQQPQHQVQQQGNQQQQSRAVLPQIPAQFHYGHPQQQPVFLAAGYPPQITAQNLPTTGQTSVTYPTLYYHRYPTQSFQPTPMWNQMSIPQAQPTGIPQAYFQAVVPGQVPAQQIQAAHQQYYTQPGPTIQPTYAVRMATNTQQGVQIQQHQQTHPGHHVHAQQHVQPNQTVQVQSVQATPPQAPETREVVPTLPRERKVLKIINPDTGVAIFQKGEPVIEAPVVPLTSVDASTQQNETLTSTSTDEVHSNPQIVIMPTVVLQTSNQSGEDLKSADVEVEIQYPRSSARTEFYQKISKSAEEDRPINESTPSPNSSSTTPMPTTSSTPTVSVEPEVSMPIPIQTPEVVLIDNDVKEEKQLEKEVVEENEDNLDITQDNIVENSLVDISSVSIEHYLDDTPETLIDPCEPAQVSETVINNELETKTPESLVKDVHLPNDVADVVPPMELPAAVPAAPTQISIPTPDQETETKSLINTTTTTTTTEKIEETPQLTDITMQGVDETVLQNGDEVIEEEEDEDGEFVDEDALDSVEDGEINDETSEEPEELGKKKRIRYDRDTLLGFKTVASKDALPDMNSIPPEVIKDSKSSSSQNHFRGSPSPNLPLRMGYNTGNRNIRNDRVPQMHTVMGRSIGGMGMMIPPPPPSTRQPKVVIELNREKVELHKAEKAWKPTPVKSRTRGAREEDKDEEEIVKDDIVKKTRGILNKLTPENFDKLVIAFLELNLEDKDDRIAAVIFVVFEKAIDEPSFSTAYANMVKTVCDKSQLTAKKFRKNILDQCQKEFQKGSNAEEEIRALEETLAAAEEDKKEELKLELTDKKYASRRRSLGNVRFIGELYKLQMLTPKIMIDCIGILLTNNDEESYESLCKLLSTIGQRLDNQLKELELRAQAASRNPQTPVKFIPPEKYMDKTFAKLKTLSIDQKLSSRIRFALLDVVELRESGWKPRRDADGPKKIVDVHRDAIRQQEQEKIQINNLPPQGPQMRQNMQPQKKMNDWSTVPSNKSSRFVVKKPTGVSSGGESTAGPMLAPNRGGSWNTPGGGASMPPKPNTFIPPRLQNQGRFGMLSQEDRAPPSTPLRENIVQAPPPPLRPHGSRPQTPTRDQPLKPDPVLAFTSTQPPPPPKDTPPVNIPESVKNIFEEYMSTNNSDDMLYYVRQKFAGEKVTEFVDELSRQVSEMSKETHQKYAGSLIKGLIRAGLINKAQVTQVFTDGVMIELPDIEVDVPKVTSYLGVFLVELFLDEPDLSWLAPLGVGIEEDNATVWTDLVTTTLNFLKLRLSEEAVQSLYKKTQCANRLPVQDLSWVTGESVEALSRKMLSVLEKEKDNGMISQSFKENSWDLREELASKSLTEAICQISWKAATGWDFPVLQRLLPQLNIASPRLHDKLWGQAKEFIRRNSIQNSAEEELWTEMYKLKLIPSESQERPHC